MAWVATAIVGGSLITAGASYLSNKDASKTSARASRNSIEEQQRQFDLQREDGTPYREAGVNALARLNNRIGQNGEPLPQFNSNTQDLPTFETDANVQDLNYEANFSRFDNNSQINSANLQQYQGGDRFDFDLASDPGYQFAQAEAAKSVNRNAAAGGKRLSGNVLAELNDRATGIASQYVDSAFNRRISESNENFNRGVSENNIVNQNTMNQQGVNRNTTMGNFGMDVTRQDMNRQRTFDEYGMAVDENNMNNQNVLTNYGINKDVFESGYRQNQDMYGRDMSEFGIDYQRNNDNYGRDQTEMNWLSTIAGTGQNAVNTSAQAGANMANSVSNTLMANANSQNAASRDMYGSINNAVQGGTSNYLAYQQNKKMLAALN